MTLPGTPIVSLPGCSIEPIEHRGTPILCVLGCLLTEAGEAIKREMIEQFRKKYDIIAVNQEPPGKFYEFPALSFAQIVSIKSDKPVLYVHTKGAGHSQNVYNQAKCRKMWYDEFINHYDEYINYLTVHSDEVMCPFTGSTKYTWINGFMAGVTAWKNVKIQQTVDRFYYEYIFRDYPVNIHGRIRNDVSFFPSTEFDKMNAHISSL